LSAIFSGRYDVSKTKDKEGRYFFDRPSKPFENILNSLRTNTLLIIPETEKEKNCLLKEIEFFGLSEYFSESLVSLNEKNVSITNDLETSNV
jgi:hypothetical protein